MRKTLLKVIVNRKTMEATVVERKPKKGNLVDIECDVLIGYACAIAHKIKAITPSLQAARTVLDGLVKVVEAMLIQVFSGEEAHHE